MSEIAFSHLERTVNAYSCLSNALHPVPASPAVYEEVLVAAQDRRYLREC
jgi:hypothetical protein